MSREREQIRICDFLIRKLENELAPHEEQELKEYLQKTPDGIELYVAVAGLYAQLYLPNKLDLELDDAEADASSIYMNLLEALGEDEKQAESFVLPKAAPSRPRIDHVCYPPREKRRISKFSLFASICSTAAVLFAVLFVHYAPPKSGPEVATLSDSINAKWEDGEVGIPNDSRLASGDRRYLLREGLVELRFDNETKVTLEAPAEFQIPTGEQIRLLYGRLYASVPQGAIGFTVNTPSARIIDLGTEFGIEADLRGDTTLHVIKGKTVLIAGHESSKASVEVGRGDAKSVSFRNQRVSDVTFDERLFARTIDSGSRLVWRGETEIDLADIVGGGSGFGGGVLNTGIDVTTGKRISGLPDKSLFSGIPGYRPIGSSPFIDGVFFPGTEAGETQVASDGSCSVPFPKTSGAYWGYIFSGAFHYGNAVPQHTLQLNGIPFGTPDHPAITIHSNQGITFDLSAIRTMIPGGRITHFRSLIGISETTRQYQQSSSVEFRVFLDGDNVFEKRMLDSDTPIQLDVPISQANRFLTLAVTESDDGLPYDWALFGRPVLVIKTSE